MLGQEGLNIPGRVMSRCVSPNPSGLATSPPPSPPTLFLLHRSFTRALPSG
jgi:hypothetical protein